MRVKTTNRSAALVSPYTVAQIAAMDDLLRELRSKSMRPIAIFVGAGMSKTFGYPITRDLMLKIFNGLEDKSILEAAAIGPGATSDAPRGRLLDFLTTLLPGERRSANKVPMVTSVLSLLDFSLSTGQALLPGRTLDELRGTRQLLERALLEVIPDHEWFEAEQEQGFENFLQWLKSLKSRRPPGGLGIITTNYDMLSDLAALYLAGVEGSPGRWVFADLANKVDFGFRWVRPDLVNEEFVSRPEHPRVSLYKLHGSTNWLRCPLCENLYIDPNGPIAWVAGSGTPASHNQCHCSTTRLEAQMVSPSFVREFREPNLIAIWKNALDLLRQADRWIIIGYSFPDEDVGVRALFTRAFGSKKRHPKISVIQLDDSSRLNYESFFPEDSLRFLTGGLSLLLSRWKYSSGRS